MSDEAPLEMTLAPNQTFSPTRAEEPNENSMAKYFSLGVSVLFNDE